MCSELSNTLNSPVIVDFMTGQKKLSSFTRYLYIVQILIATYVVVTNEYGLTISIISIIMYIWFKVWISRVVNEFNPFRINKNQELRIIQQNIIYNSCIDKLLSTEYDCNTAAIIADINILFQYTAHELNILAYLNENNKFPVAQLTSGQFKYISQILQLELKLIHTMDQHTFKKLEISNIEITCNKLSSLIDIPQWKQNRSFAPRYVISKMDYIKVQVEMIYLIEVIGHTSSLETLRNLSKSANFPSIRKRAQSAIKQVNGRARKDSTNLLHIGKSRYDDDLLHPNGMEPKEINNIENATHSQDQD